jgi:hypothetical protein
MHFILFHMFIANKIVMANILAPGHDMVFNERKMIFETQRCEPVTMPMCRDLDYNLTSLPNQFNHESQQDAAMEVCLCLLICVLP